MATIQRSACGRVAQLGALYDARTESFVHDSIFCSKLEDDDIDQTELGDTTVEFITSDRIEDKFHKLGIEAELQVSLMAGLVKLSGSATYLNESKKSARAVSMSLVYKVRTTSEEIYIGQHRKNIDVEMLQASIGKSTDATHVVVGITWGAACSITCEYENNENEEITEVEGSLSAELSKMAGGLVDVKGSAKVDYEDKTKGIGNKFSFYSKCDVSTTDNNLPVTFEEAKEQAKNLPNLVKKTNKGKGIPLMFELVPLEKVLKICKLQLKVNVLFQAVREDTVKQCVQAVESLTNTKQRLYDLRTDLKRNKNYIVDDILTNLDKLADGYLVAESKFRTDLQEHLKRVRSFQEDISELHKLIKESVGETFSTSRVEEELRKYQFSLNKIQEVHSMQTLGIIYVGKQDQFNVHNDKTIYVLFADDVISQQEQISLNRSKTFFQKLLQTHKDDNKVQFIVVDLAVRPDLEDHNNLKICKYINGEMVSSDVMKDEGENTDKCLIEMKDTKYVKDRPNDRSLVKIRCPNSLSGSGQCSGDLMKWSCKKCKEDVWYGIKTKLFYCKCGSSKPETALFRCNEIKHGMTFVNYPKDILEPELSSLRAIKEINILILGETGVGKSTWINGFANYLFFDNLQDAVSSDDFVTVIPSKFTFTNNNGETKDITIGNESGNENFTTGQSATQEPVAYPFYVGEQMVRLIDTPGIGDSRGIEQDKKNFENILAHLTYYEEIHGVCILLKPNNARLTVLFRFCIQQLLAHLHKDAAHNIVFCFTNARGNFYRPGDTLPALRKELKDKNVGIDATPQNMFCFDNEAFRFLACVRNGIEFADQEKEAFSTSWNIAVKETERLFEHISTLQPHRVLNTLSLNDARRIIVELSRPMAEITITIQKNIKDMEDYKEKIQLVDTELEDFKTKLHFSGVDLEHVQLGYPRTVCTHSDCTEYIASGKDNIQQVNYKQHCHSHCYLSGVSTETVGDSRLQGCAAMNNNVCGECGHSYEVHMHRTYDLISVSRQFISDGVQAKINEKQGGKAKLEEFKKNLDKLVVEMKYEETQVLKISAKFGSFLKDFAIIPYNDAMGDYLDMIIEQENQKSKGLRDAVLVGRLQHSRKAYEVEKRILDEAMTGTHDGKISTPGEVKMLQKELFNLKHFGKSLENIFNQIEQEKKKANQTYRQGEVPVPRYRMYSGTSSDPSKSKRHTKDKVNEPKGGNFLVNGLRKIFSWR